jgi:hypothetical protein
MYVLQWSGSDTLAVLKYADVWSRAVDSPTFNGVYFTFSGKSQVDIFRLNSLYLPLRGSNGLA